MVEPLGAMPIGPFGPGPTEQGMPGEFAPVTPAKPGESFMELLKQSIDEVNTMQTNASTKVQKLVTGEISNIHEVMIASEEAGIAFNLLMQIRNHLLSAWDELKRVQV